MSARPSSLPRWCTTGDRVEPPEEKKDVGHVPGERSPAQYENHWKNLSFKWSEHFADGDWIGPVTVDGSAIAASASTDATIQATNGNIVATGDTASYQGMIDGQVSLWSRPEPMKFSAASGGPPSGSTATRNSNGYAAAAAPGDSWTHGADALIGDGAVAHVLSSMTVQTNRAASGTITVVLKKINASGTVATVATATRNSGTGWAATTVAIADHVVEAGSKYFLLFVAGDTGDQYAGAELKATKRWVD